MPADYLELIPTFGILIFLNVSRIDTTSRPTRELSDYSILKSETEILDGTSGRTIPLFNNRRSLCCVVLRASAGIDRSRDRSTTTQSRGMHRSMAGAINFPASSSPVTRN